MGAFLPLLDFFTSPLSLLPLLLPLLLLRLPLLLLLLLPLLPLLLVLLSQPSPPPGAILLLDSTLLPDSTFCFLLLPLLCSTFGSTCLGCSCKA